MRFVPILAAACLFAAGLLMPLANAATGCQFLSGGGPAAFCDTFDAPAGIGDSAGDLNGNIWGASRWTGNENPGAQLYAGWATVALNKCGSTVQVAPPHDIAICNGQVVEAVNDTTSEANVSMYPRQPFDISNGRTGTVVMDVSDDSGGTHTAWPQFSFTDQPVPAPHPMVAGNDTSSMPRNAVEVSLGAACGLNCGSGPPRTVGVDTISVISNYVKTDVAFKNDGSVLEPAQGDIAHLNHFEFRLSAGGIKVYGSDAGNPASTKLIADAAFTMPLSTGLVWMQDTHYNGNKPCDSDPSVPCQQTHTFAWDNFGFDGPVLPRDSGFIYPDNNVSNGTADNGLPVQNLYYSLSNSMTLTWPATRGAESVRALSNVAGASGAILEVSVYAFSQPTLTYALNGNPPHSYSGASGQTPVDYDIQSWVMPIPLSELHDGNNTIVLSGTAAQGGLNVGNLNLILIGAGGGGTAGTPVPSPTVVPPTSTPVLPTPTSVPATVAPTSGPSANQFAITMHQGASLDLTCSGGTLSQGESSGSNDVVLNCE